MRSCKTILLQASARSQGDTYEVSAFIIGNYNIDFLDLKTKAIGQYDYAHANKSDDFIPIMKDISKNYQNIIFITPVYWYTMSGLLKVFLDRITDLLTIEKDVGRKLRGKNLGIISSCNDDDIKPEFEMPFKESASYLGMQYLGHIHTWVEDKKINPVAEERIIKYFDSIDL